MKFSESRPHPWHGLPPGREPPGFLTAFIEITPWDGVKYEVDKPSGYLKVDRPQLASSLPPALYGFIPKTFCGAEIGAIAGAGIKGDGDPLDVCVLSERPITRSEVLVPCRVIGGLRLIDRGEADDKIIAVLEGDPAYADVFNLSDLPSFLVTRLTHYFLTYKWIPGSGANPIRIDRSYEASEAHEVVRASFRDYEALRGSFGV